MRRAMGAHLVEQQGPGVGEGLDLALVGHLADSRQLAHVSLDIGVEVVVLGPNPHLLCPEQVHRCSPGCRSVQWEPFSVHIAPHGAAATRRLG